MSRTGDPPPEWGVGCEQMPPHPGSWEAEDNRGNAGHPRAPRPAEPPRPPGPGRCAQRSCLPCERGSGLPAGDTASRTATRRGWGGLREAARGRPQTPENSCLENENAA